LRRLVLALTLPLALALPLSLRVLTAESAEKFLERIDLSLNWDALLGRNVDYCRREPRGKVGK
jgi:hypothetical protein